MQLQFDPDKDAANIRKHGLSLSQAAGLDLSTALILPDERADYGEPRSLAFGPVEGRLLALVFTMRGPIVRAISLRPANRTERERFVDASA